MALSGRRSTKVPAPWRETTMPSSRRLASASRTTVRDTAKRSANSISVGSLDPCANSPSTTRAKI
jgi:hypothetical protein